ncbi:Pentatricopeptide repeat-containing protein [Vigna angularis]|uniref:Pentatricopeptide repeat-containing protein n=1 Tax=Phaseolus angularis TaxID=3914 RepID=A0A8T0JV53_PHAAN|nr:Pentatricopeptide repeat-containing protein [Vigna angularis]
MEGTLFPNRPVLPAPAPRLTQQPSKFKPNFLPPQSPPPPPPSFQLDSLLQHLQHLSSVPITTPTLTLVPASKDNSTHFNNSLHSKQKKPSLASDPVVEQDQLDDAKFGFLSDKGKLLLNSIVGSPLHELNGFFNSVEFELLEVDFLSLLKALDLSGNWERALLLFEWGWLHFGSEQNLRLDNQVVELMVRIMGRESQHSIASKLFGLIPVEQYSLDVRAYTTVLHAYARTGKYKRAIVLFGKMNEFGLDPTLVTYNVMLDVYGKMGRSWSRILELLDEMRIKGLEFDEFTCSTVISACGREGMLDEARKFFAELKLNGYKPGTVTYNTMLQALSILKEMEDNNCPLDSVTYNELAATYVRAGFLDQGKAVIDTMTSKGIMPNAITYTTVIDAYGKKSRTEDVINVLCEMKLNGCAPNRATWNTMLVVCSEEGNWKAAESVILDMRSKGFKPNETSYSLMLPCYSKAGNVKGIQVIEKEIYDGHVFSSWILLRTLILSNHKCRHHRGMERAFNKLHKYGYKPDLVVINSMLSMYSRNKMFSKAHEMMHFIYENGLQPNLFTYNCLMDLYVREGECWKAEEILKGIQNSGPEPDVVSYNTVIKGFCRKGLMQEAIRVLSEMTTKGIQPTIVSYNTFLSGYVGMELFDEAIEVIRFMIEHNCRPNELTYKIVVDGYCKAGKHEQAMDFVSKIKEIDISLDDRYVKILGSCIRERMGSVL